MHIPNTKSIHGWMVMGGISNMVMSIFFFLLLCQIFQTSHKE